jgi:dTDP-glucose pyrophosphorylase
MGPDLLKRYSGIVVSPSATLRDAMAAMTRHRIGIVLVVDKARRLLGVAADIDIRRSLLREGSMDMPVARSMNSSPVTVLSGTPDDEIAAAFRLHPKAHIPIIDAKRRLVGLAAADEYSSIPPHRPNRVVLMAGGLGKRLGPLTQGTPKPMLPLGEKPILEVLLEQFKASGFGDFLFSVNHLAERIMDHFGDGKRWGVRIEYLRETKPLGTVGALSLIKGPVREPILVANGDILTKVDFGALLDFHKAEGAVATLCVKSHEVHIPYGIVEIDGYRLQSFVEKPTHRTYINAGIYVLEPKALSWLARGKHFDMPQFIALIQKRRKKGVACFPIQEYWLDIGEHQAYRKAAGDYTELFG